MDRVYQGYTTGKKSFALKWKFIQAKPKVKRIVSKVASRPQEQESKR